MMEPFQAFNFIFFDGKWFRVRDCHFIHSGKRIKWTYAKSEFFWEIASFLKEDEVKEGERMCVLCHFTILYVWNYFTANVSFLLVFWEFLMIHFYHIFPYSLLLLDLSTQICFSLFLFKPTKYSLYGSYMLICVVLTVGQPTLGCILKVNRLSLFQQLDPDI